MKKKIKYLESSLIEEDSKSINKKMKKLFCLAYIRVFIYKFIHILKEDHTGFDEKIIIKSINGEKETKLREMIKLYLYKVVFNINGNDINSLEFERFKLKNLQGLENFMEKSIDTIFLKIITK